MFINFKISYRGNIRRAPSIVTWASTLMNLCKQGHVSWTQVIKDWNMQASKNSHLVGQKAVSVKLLMESCPDTVFKLIIDHVSRHGWHGSAFSDDSLATKKIMPGFKIVLPNGTTLVVTLESITLMFQNIDSDWDRRVPTMRKKFPKKDMEVLAMHSCLLLKMRDMAVEKTRLDRPSLESLLQDFRENDPQLMLELQGSADDSVLDPLHITKIKELARLCNTGGATVGMNEVVKVQELQASLNEVNFEIFQKQLEADVVTINIHSQKMSSLEAVLYWRDLTQWKEQYNFYETKAQNLLDDCVKFEVFTSNAADSINHLKAYKKDTARKYNIPEPCLVT